MIAELHRSAREESPKKRFWIAWASEHLVISLCDATAPTFSTTSVLCWPRHAIGRSPTHRALRTSTMVKSNDIIYLFLRYYGHITREQADSLLRQRGTEGDFLVIKIILFGLIFPRWRYATVNPSLATSPFHWRTARRTNISGCSSSQPAVNSSLGTGDLIPWKRWLCGFFGYFNYKKWIFPVITWASQYSAMGRSTFSCGSHCPNDFCDHQRVSQTKAQFIAQFTSKMQLLLSCPNGQSAQGDLPKLQFLFFLPLIHTSILSKEFSICMNKIYYFS